MSDGARWSDRITAEITWSSNDPHLRDHFAPVGPEIEQSDLPVVAGRIPPDLRGVYMRNGPNPLFKPMSYTYPLDGDGMIHAVYFEEGRARYKNRYVRTRSLSVERRAQRAVYGGVLHPTPVDENVVGDDGDPGPIKNGAFISAMGLGDRVLALGEAATAYEMTRELETLGEWTAGSAEPITLGAHNHCHPDTGKLFALDYSIEEPLVRIHQIHADGRLERTFPVSLTFPSMIHDFVLTRRHLILLVGPAIFDAEASSRGEALLQWRGDLGSRIGLIPLDGGAPLWIEADPFFVFHFANGFEHGSDLIIDYVRHGRLRLGPPTDADQPPRLHRLVIDLTARRVRDERIAAFATEMPRIDHRFEAIASRFIYVPVRTSTLKLDNSAGGTFNGIACVDARTGGVGEHDLGNRVCGEPVFIPRPGSAGEADGYVSVFVYDPAVGTSDLVLLDASDVAREPVAVIRLPQRVPQGLHGSWIPK